MTPTRTAWQRVLTGATVHLRFDLSGRTHEERL